MTDVLGNQPVGGFAYPWIIHIEPNGPQSGQDQAGSIDVIDSPVPKPTAIRLLLAEEIAHGFRDDRVAQIVAQTPQRLELVARQIRAGLVQDLAEIAKRDAGGALGI